MADNFIEEIVENDLESGRVKKIQTRFPPEPNGHLHIGHVKAISIDYGIAKKYKGKFFLRFDDTNPVKEESVYVEGQKQDLLWLGFKWDKLIFASDYFEEIYGYAELLIKKGLAFVCELNAEELREYRGTLTEKGKESPYRNRSVEDNLRLFREMRAGIHPEGRYILRAKIDMQSGNINMRDPVIYRILHATHHNTGDKWCIYPMYDFAHPLEDAIEGTTHSLCSLEYEDHRPLYDWVTEHCEFKKRPRQIEFARLNLNNTIMSKRYLKELVDSGKVDGWDDPRLPTVGGMRRRGYPPEAVKKFCALAGVAKANSTVDSAMLEFCVREQLNTEAPRLMAVTSPVKVVITNYEGSEVLELENNPANPIDLRKVSFSKELYIDGADFAEVPPPKYHRLTLGGNVRLKGAYIIRCDEIVKNKDGTISHLNCTYFPETKSGSAEPTEIKAKGVIQWVNAADHAEITLNNFEYLMSDDGNFNENSKKTLTAYAEPAAKNLKAGKSVQFMRIGYYCPDTKSKAFNQVVPLVDKYRPEQK